MLRPSSGELIPSLTSDLLGLSLRRLVHDFLCLLRTVLMLFFGFMCQRRGRRKLKKSCRG